jgi:hypothetical protein
MKQQIVAIARNKTRWFSALFFALALPLAARDWPQAVRSPNDFSLCFAASRENRLSTALVFASPARIKSADSGTVLAVVRAPDADSEFFHSPLGNAVIVDHHDGFIATYGNLSEIAIENSKTHIEQGETLGVSGASSWQQETAGLEFQAFDAKDGKSINPRTLLPLFRNEKPLRIRGIMAVNKKGEKTALQPPVLTLPADNYTLFHEMEPDNIPYKTEVTVNGALVETLSYDMLIERNGALTVKGNKYYAAPDLYASETMMLLGNIMLTQGRSTVIISASDINGVESPPQRFSITIE